MLCVSISPRAGLLLKRAVLGVVDLFALYILGLATSLLTKELSWGCLLYLCPATFLLSHAYTQFGVGILCWFIIPILLLPTELDYTVPKYSYLGCPFYCGTPTISVCGFNFLAVLGVVYFCFALPHLCIFLFQSQTQLLRSIKPLSCVRVSW